VKEALIDRWKISGLTRNTLCSKTDALIAIPNFNLPRLEIEQNENNEQGTEELRAYNVFLTNSDIIARTLFLAGYLTDLEVW